MQLSSKPVSLYWILDILKNISLGHDLSFYLFFVHDENTDQSNKESV